MDKVVQIHAAAIHSLHISANKSFAVTGSEDGMLRLWRGGNLEFSNNKGGIIFEEKLEAPVVATSVAPLSNGVSAVLKNGSLVHLDVESKRIRYKMRSHGEAILDFVASESYLVTISRDRTIRIWDALVPPFV